MASYPVYFWPGVEQTFKFRITLYNLRVVIDFIILLCQLWWGIIVYTLPKREPWLMAVQKTITWGNTCWGQIFLLPGFCLRPVMFLSKFLNLLMLCFPICKMVVLWMAYFCLPKFHLLTPQPPALPVGWRWGCWEIIRFKWGPEGRTSVEAFLSSLEEEHQRYCVCLARILGEHGCLQTRQSIASNLSICHVLIYNSVFRSVSITHFMLKPPSL